MIIITTGANNIEFNASAQIEYSNYIMTISSKSHTYSVEVALNDPVVNNDRYLQFAVTQVSSPDLDDAEFELPNAGEYNIVVYNTDTDISSGVVIFRGILVMHLNNQSNTVYVESETNKVWNP